MFTSSASPDTVVAVDTSTEEVSAFTKISVAALIVASLSVTAGSASSKTTADVRTVSTLSAVPVNVRPTASILLAVSPV